MRSWTTNSYGGPSTSSSTASTRDGSRYLPSDYTDRYPAAGSEPNLSNCSPDAQREKAPHRQPAESACFKPTSAENRPIQALLATPTRSPAGFRPHPAPD